MKTAAADLTKEGIARYQAGDLPGAADFFVHVVRVDPTYEMAWLWLSSCLSLPGEKRYCLDRALAANPQSAPAQKGLAQLGNVAAIRPAALDDDDSAVPPPVDVLGPVGTTKQCPFCAETIQIAAIVCRHCGKDLRPPAPSRPRVVTNGQGGFVCSACGGGVRGDAATCKHCQAVFDLSVPAPAAAKKKAPVWAYALVTLVILGSCYFFLIAPALSQAKRYDVTYRISGTTRAASLTIQNASEGSEQRDVDVPWTSSFKAHDGQFLYLSAQNKWDAGVVTCEILFNGEVVRTATADTAYGIATCSAKV